MYAFPGVFGAQRNTVQRSNTAYSTTTVAPAATIGVYTSTPVQLVSSTAYDVSMIRLTAVASTANSGLRGDLVADLMIGSAGSETSIAGGLIFGGLGAYSSYTLPIYIPAGSRLSLRTAAGVASRSGRTFTLDYWGSPNRDYAGLPSRWIAYGVTISSGNGAYGTPFTPGNSNTWGSWTTLGQSTYAHDLWLPMLGVYTATAITAQTYRSQFAIAGTTDAATMVTNTTGAVEGPVLTGNTSEALGPYTATFPTKRGIEDMIYAPRSDSAYMSVRGMASGTADSNALGGAILAAVK